MASRPRIPTRSVTRSQSSSQVESSTPMVEFTAAEVEDLLVKRRIYSRYNEEEKSKLSSFVERLQNCIRWFKETNNLDKERRRSSDMEALAKEAEASLTSLSDKMHALGKMCDVLRDSRMNEQLAEAKSTCSAQSEQIKRLEEQLKQVEEKLSDISAMGTRCEFEEHEALIAGLNNRLADADAKIIEGEKLCKKLHNTIMELKGNIRVFCRVRPLLSDDGVGTDAEVVSYPTSMELLGRGIDLTQNGQKHSFTFDKVFTPNDSQEDVFVEISHLVQSSLDGYKVCILAYGHTGSGKTYTMIGNPRSPDQKGLIPRSLEQVFQTKQMLEARGWKYKIKVSMLEVYNDNIRDLLAPERDASRVDNAGKQYSINHDPSGNTYVSDLTIQNVHSSDEISSLLTKAAKIRSVGKTQMNQQSSRSHFVFTLGIIGVRESTDQEVQGVLNLIDLAGNQRLTKSESIGVELKETQFINQSLSYLCDVIIALVKKEEHVPFRNCKLTQLLEPYLGGDSKTLMLINISPDRSSVNESLCSLRFASRVKACEIGQQTGRSKRPADFGLGTATKRQRSGGSRLRTTRTATRLRTTRSATRLRMG